MCSDVKILVDVCACLLLDYKSLIWCPIHHGVARRGTNPKTQELSLIELAKLVKSARHLGLVLLPRFSSNSRLMRVVCDRKRPFTLTECESRLGWELWEYMGLFYDRNPTGFLLENESIKGKREINDLSFLRVGWTIKIVHPIGELLMKDWLWGESEQLAFMGNSLKGVRESCY